jgi:hypothetical protein
MQNLGIFLIEIVLIPMALSPGSNSKLGLNKLASTQRETRMAKLVSPLGNFFLIKLPWTRSNFMLPAPFA